MSFFNDEQKLTKHFLDAWELVTNPYAAIPVDLVSQKSEPVGGKLIRFRIKRALSSGKGLGNYRRNYGSVMVQIVLPVGSGSGEILEIADRVSVIFQ